MVRSIKQLAHATIAAAFLWAATGASAQLAVYRNADPAEQVSERTEAAPAQQQSGAETDAPAPQPRRSFVPSRRSALVNANEAKRRLEQAELKRKLGEEPRASERTPAAGGFTVNYRYWQRQEKLRIEVDQAQRRVNATQRPLVANRWTAG